MVASADLTALVIGAGVSGLTTAICLAGAGIPVADMPRYLAYLERRLAATGTTVEIGTVGSLDEVGRSASVVVNCAGLGARALVGDPDLYGTAGQVVIVANPGIDHFFQDLTD